jgi:hypothetical protein
VPTEIYKSEEFEEHVFNFLFFFNRHRTDCYEMQRVSTKRF